MKTEDKHHQFRIKKPLLWAEEFFPASPESDKALDYFRDRLFSGKNPNLNYLVKCRYEWMKKHIRKEDTGLEVGAGIGASKYILQDYTYLVTDCYHHAWIDKVIDATNLPFDNSSFQYILASNVIHHLNKPMLFFEEAYRVLDENGLIIINDVSNSLFMRLLLKTLKHEGYSYERNPFDKNQDMSSDGFAWTGNDAVMDIMLSDKLFFEKQTSFEILLDQRTEFFIFLMSGGISSEFFTINMPHFILKFLENLDKIMCYKNNIFPLSRKTILRKKTN